MVCRIFTYSCRFLSYAAMADSSQFQPGCKIVVCHNDRDGGGRLSPFRQKIWYVIQMLLHFGSVTSNWTLTSHVSGSVNGITFLLFQSVTLHTDVGDIKIELFCEACPRSSEVRSSFKYHSRFPCPSVLNFLLFPRRILWHYAHRTTITVASFIETSRGSWFKLAILQVTHLFNPTYSSLLFPSYMCLFCSRC